MKKLVIFGSGDLADIAHYFFSSDSEYEVVAFTLDEEYIKDGVCCGLPVIAFNSGGIKETILDDITGFLVPEKDIDTMVYKTESLINDFELREKVNAAKEHYKWQNYTQNYSFKTVKDIPFYSESKKQVE